MRALLFAVGTALGIAAFPAVSAVPAASQVTVIEFYHKALDHYFITADAKEIADLESGVHTGWTRTGMTFQAVKAGAQDPGTTPVCRFYGRPDKGLDSHFYAASTAECETVRQMLADHWTLESTEVFRTFAVDPTTGKCAADTEPIHRLWNKRADVNHRYTDQVAVFQEMVGKGYEPEGDGDPARPVVFCVPMKAASTTPVCTLTPSATTASVGSTVVITANCSNSPTSWGWSGCSGTTNTCNATATAAGVATYGVTASNAAGPGAAVSTQVTWQAAVAGAVPICTVTGTSTTPSVGSQLTMTANCSQSPTRYEWKACSYLAQSACSAIASCSQTSRTCTVTNANAEFAHYALVGSNASGAGPVAGFDAEWRGGTTQPPPTTPPPAATAAPVCSVGASNPTPAVGTVIQLFAGCSNDPTSFSWTGCAGAGSRCQATSNVAGEQEYSLVALNAAGSSSPATVKVNWGGGSSSSPPSNCSVTASNSTPTVGTTITLTASCSGTVDGYAWEAGCSGTGSTCSHSSANPGAQTYQVRATNAFGSATGSTQVVWQAPPSGPPVCTVTASSSSPFTGQLLTLTADCTNQPTSYQWTNCSSTGRTCTTTSQTTGNQSYSVRANNVLGTQGPESNPVTVNWQQPLGGADFCPAYGGDVIRMSVPWGSTSRTGPNDYGGVFRSASILAIQITLPSSGSPSFHANVVEYQGPPTARNVTVSRSACDFRNEDRTGINGPFSVDNAVTASASGGVASGLVAGGTYYLNIRNWSPYFNNGAGGNSCNGANCNLAVDWHWQ